MRESQKFCEWEREGTSDEAILQYRIKSLHKYTQTRQLSVERKSQCSSQQVRWAAQIDPAPPSVTILLFQNKALIWSVTCEIWWQMIVSAMPWDSFSTCRKKSIDALELELVSFCSRTKLWFDHSLWLFIIHMAETFFWTWSTTHPQMDEPHFGSNRDWVLKRSIAKQPPRIQTSYLLFARSAIRESLGL